MRMLPTWGPLPWVMTNCNPGGPGRPIAGRWRGHFQTEAAVPLSFGRRMALPPRATTARFIKITLSQVDIDAAGSGGNSPCNMNPFIITPANQDLAAMGQRVQPARNPGDCLYRQSELLPSPGQPPDQVGVGGWLPPAMGGMVAGQVQGMLVQVGDEGAEGPDLRSFVCALHQEGGYLQMAFALARQWLAAPVPGGPGSASDKSPRYRP